MPSWVGCTPGVLNSPADGLRRGRAAGAGAPGRAPGTPGLAPGPGVAGFAVAAGLGAGAVLAAGLEPANAGVIDAEARKKNPKNKAPGTARARNSLTRIALTTIWIPILLNF